MIFDCDGVLVDSEPAHFEAFREALAGEGLPLTREDYFGKYLAFDDGAFFRMVFDAHRRHLAEDTLRRLLERKGATLAGLLAELPVIRSSFEFARRARNDGLAVGVASGARRTEVESVLLEEVSEDVDALVTAEDVRRGKPHPEPYLLALRILCSGRPAGPILAEECLVVEDALHGVRSAVAAGMRVLALTTSYSAEELREADLVRADLADLTPGDAWSRIEAQEAGR